MTYSANQYNYCTPLSSAPGLFGEAASATDKKYFTLHDNILDGSYFPVTGDVGLWGTSLSDASGYLPEPYVFTDNGEHLINAFRIRGSAYAYPVDFTVKFYNGDTLLHTITETGNTSPTPVYYLPASLNVTSYEFTISRISSANSVVRLLNVYNPSVVHRVDTFGIKLLETAVYGSVIKRADTIDVKALGKTAVTNTIDVTRDMLKPAIHSEARPTNIHTRMKEFSRSIYGKVYITYTDPLLDSETSIETNMEAYNSQSQQVIDMITEPSGKFFTLYENNLTGEYTPSDERSQVGWTSSTVSDADGRFEVNPYITVSFSERPIVSMVIYFNDTYGAPPVDFTVSFATDTGIVTNYITNNHSNAISVIEGPIGNVHSVTVEITKTAPGTPANIIEIPVVSTLLYKGYKDESDIVSIDTLEELTYEDDIEALGGISANETTIVLDNSNKDFFFNNPLSPIAKSLRRNRKIVPYLGAEIIPGEIEWYSLGTYWSYSWDVPVDGMTAKVVGFDTIGLIGTTSFFNHQVQVNKSLGDLVEYVLSDAKEQLDFIEWQIDEALYDIRIPYAWFENGSHAAALRKISLAYPMHIYCNRDGVIVAAPQRLRLDHYNDIWSDDTNVINKTYSSLHTTLPNIINVSVKNVALVEEESLVSDALQFNVRDINNRTLTFSKPCVSNLAVIVDKDSGVEYTYEAYSWGVSINFTGTGNVRSIRCSGLCIDNSNSAIVSHKDTESIRLNGAITREISSDFIQTSDLATLILNRFIELSKYDKYDADVKYRGDIALSINDAVHLLNGIAPDNRYTIKRHELHWDGSLTASAALNT